MTEEHETPSRVWAGLHIQQINASIKPFMFSERIVESFQRFCCMKEAFFISLTPKGSVLVGGFFKTIVKISCRDNSSITFTQQVEQKGSSCV